MQRNMRNRKFRKSIQSKIIYKRASPACSNYVLDCAMQKYVNGKE